MKEEKNMKEWRHLAERQDHNEGQKDRTKEGLRESKHCVENTLQQFSQLEKDQVGSSCIPFSQLE